MQPGACRLDSGTAAGRLAIVAVAAFAFTAARGECLLTLNLQTSPNEMTLPLAVQTTVAPQYTVHLGLSTACGVIISLPSPSSSPLPCAISWEASPLEV